MDANQTRFQLVFGEADWFGNPVPGSPPPRGAPAGMARLGCDRRAAAECLCVSRCPGRDRSKRCGPARRRRRTASEITTGSRPHKTRFSSSAPNQQQAQHFWSASDLIASNRASGFGHVLSRRFSTCSSLLDGRADRHHRSLLLVG